MDTGFLSTTPLFAGISEREIEHVLGCLQARERTYQKGEVIFRAGTRITDIGLIESGGANMTVVFYWGYSRIFGHFEAGDVIGENYAALPDTELPGDMIAVEETRVLFMDLKRIMTTCSQCCSYHHDLMMNLLRIAARKNLELSRRMMQTSSRSIRERLLMYLSRQADIHGGPAFSIPFDRQQLADYLGVDRSALSAELARMKRDGLIDYRKNEFVLHSEARLD